MRRIVAAIAPVRLGWDFRWLFAASWTTNIGDGIAVAAGPLLMTVLTRDPGLVALALGAVIGGRFGVTGPFWFAFGGSVITLALIWRELSHIADTG